MTAAVNRVPVARVITIQRRDHVLGTATEFRTPATVFGRWAAHRTVVFYDSGEPTPEGFAKGWTVTHVASGLATVREITEAEAIAVAAALEAGDLDIEVDDPMKGPSNELGANMIIAAVNKTLGRQAIKPWKAPGS